MTGTTIGRYELLEKLGEGGMGVVYRARDVLLNRFAALKLLPQDPRLDEDRRRRFLQEAQMASALNHPNIVTIYEVGVEPPHEFIAMEYVPGQPLDKLIGGNGLSCAEAVKYATQIADALAAAHSAGIIHRDIKPANVIVSGDGRAKVLDFGIAKLVEPVAHRAAADVTRTFDVKSSPRTVEGAITGTAAYMSPEQAEGKPLDHRSDIFAFGAMLYEMLSGRRAFPGDSPVSTLAAILRADAPRLTDHLPDMPREFDRLIRRCLEKSQDRRWQSMADVRAILEDLSEDLQSQAWTRTAPSAAGTQARPRRIAWVAALAGVLMLAGLAAGVLWFRPPSTSATEAYSFRRLTSDPGSNVSPALSPDGKMVAYSSDRSQSGATDIWVQQVAGGQAVRLTSDLGLCHSPTFSPDGSTIAFHGGPDAQGIYVTSALGGGARRVADGRGPEFSPDGSLIAFMGGTNDRIMLVPATGGTPREIKVKHGVINRARWLPDGRRLLFLGADSSSGRQSFDWYSIGIDGGEEKSCGATKWLPDSFLRMAPHTVLADTVLMYAGDGQNAHVYRVPFDSREARITGSPVPVTMGPYVNFWPSASADGARIAFGSAAGFNTNIWSIALDPNSGSVAGEPQPITEGLVDRLAPYPSANGNRLAYKITLGDVQELRVRDLATRQETKIAETSEATPPVISSDGMQVAYAVRENGALAIYTAAASGGVPRRVCADCGRPVSWLAADAGLLFDQAAKNTEIGILNIRTGQKTIILRAGGGARIYTPRVSPNGRVLCFTRMTGPADRRTFVTQFSGEGLIPESEWTRLTAGPGQDEREPFWSRDGRLLYFLSERDGFRCVWATRMQSDGLKASGESFGIHHLHQFRYSLLDFNNVADIGLSLAGNKMFLAVREIRSNIWLAERRPLQSMSR